MNGSEKEVNSVLTEDKIQEASKNSSVVAEGGVAEVNGIQFKTIQAAFDNVSDGETVVLREDADIENTIVLDNKKDITLNANGKKIYNTKDIWDVKEGDWSLISLRNSASLTITGNGSFIAKSNDIYAIDVQDGSTCTIENGVYVGNITAVYVLEGTAVINGGNYSIIQSYPDSKKATEFVLNCHDKEREQGIASIVVTGGTYTNFNPSDCWAEGEHTNFVKEGYSVESKTVDGQIGVTYYIVVVAD
ncbi:uncharacterized protein BN617_00872 [Firmicutes bacterium CAG:345]|nr:uncharacterized protein BN617_00872 [Firmicutes bacterium CAG:345]